jgi:DNA-binding transcriptional LysR family regulator
MDNELALRLFVSVVEANSFSKGGARLNVPQSSASRIISHLEERLGARLLHRSTRNLTLTEAGQIYYERATRIATELDEAAEAVREVSAAPAGLLRVMAPATFARKFIAPRLQEFHTLYPDITIGLLLSDSVEDMIGLGYDVAIRLGDLQDSSLIASRIAGSTSLICASPEYLRMNGAPKTVQDLKGHNCLQFRSNHGENTWRFRSNGTDHAVQVSGSFFSNNGDAILAAALSGLGICYLPEWMVHEHLETGALQLVLPDLNLETGVTPIQAVASYRLHTPAKQRVFVGFLREKLSVLPWVRA